MVMATQQTMGGWSTKPGMGKFFMLFSASLALAISKFMVVFAPVPIVIGILIYGRTKGYLGILGTLITAKLMSPLTPYFHGVEFSYIVAVILSLFIAESFLRKFHPMKAVITSGSIIIALTFGIVAQQMSQGFSLKKLALEKIEESKEVLEREKEALLKKGETEAIAMVDLLEKPEELADLFVKNIPVYFIMGIFFILWLNFYMILRTYHFYAPPSLLRYSELTFLTFKVPDQALFLVVGALGATIYGEYENLEWYSYVGSSLLKCLGVFYFFQGFGVVITFFNVYRIFGFFRTLTIILIVMMASWVIAVLGLFDTWFDFRRLVLKKKAKDKDKN